MSIFSPVSLGHRARRALWLVAGAAALALGLVGVFVPVLPTVPFVLLAAMCFSHGCARCERWLLEHPRLGPPLRAWREQHAVSRRAKWLATLSMAVGSALAWWLLDGWPRWLPALACVAVAGWLWWLPEPVLSRAAAPRQR
jgi:uncharacterized membrane protein YbaN (DUF454 family)